MKVRTKAGALLVILAIVLSTVVFAGFQQNKAAIEADQAQNVRYTSTDIADDLDEQLAANRRSVRLHATNPSVAAHGTAAQAAALASFVAESEFDGVSVLSRNGTMTAISAGLDRTTRERLVGENFSERTYFQRARAGETYIGEPLRADSDNQVVTISTPIYENGTVVGTLNAALHLRRGSVWSDAASAAAEQYGIVVQTESGETIYERQPDPSTELVGGTARVEATGWTVTVRGSRTLLADDLRQVTLYQTGGVGLVVFLLGLVGFVAYTRMVRYHEQLLDGFSKIEQGEYGYRIDTDAAGEFRRLIEGFNRVSRDLEGYDSDIRTKQRELGATNAVLTSVLDNLPVGVLVEDADREVTTANDELFDVLDLPGEPSDIVGRDCAALTEELDSLFADPEAFRRRNEEILERRELVVEEDIGLADGRTLARSYTSYDLPDGTGNLWLYRDITERRDRKQQLRVLGRVLRHNIRNDMNVIRGRAELFRDGTVSDVNDQGAKIIEQSDKLLETTQKEQAITKVLLDSPDPKPAALHSLLERVVTDVQEDHPDAAFTIECPLTIHVLAISHLEVAIEELLTNAVVHSETASPTVIVRVAERGDTVQLDVRDEGPHIPEREQAVLSRGSTIDELFHGTGLGLWVVYWIVKRSKGSVEVTTHEPVGNTVTVTLQRSDAP